MKPAFDGGDIAEDLAREDRRSFWDEALFAKLICAAILEEFKRTIPMGGCCGGVEALVKSRKSARRRNPGVMAGQQPFLKLHQRRSYDMLGILIARVKCDVGDSRMVSLDKEIGESLLRMPD